MGVPRPDLTRTPLPGCERASGCPEGGRPHPHPSRDGGARLRHGWTIPQAQVSARAPRTTSKGGVYLPCCFIRSAGPPMAVCGMVGIGKVPHNEEARMTEPQHSALITEHGQLYKVTTEDGCANVAPVSFQWPVRNGTPGAWVKAAGKMVPCENGSHLCRRQDLVEWLGPAIFEA